MNRLRASIIGLGLAFVAAACAKGDLGGTTGTAGTSGSVCSSGLTACGQACVDAMTDAMNCGGCGIPCSTGQLCQNGACQCQSGMLCNGGCVSSDATHCGNCTTTCQANQVCSDNACSSSGCAAGQTLCGTACVVTNGNDVLNCGGCGTTCVAGQACNGGSCGCAVGQMMCGATCMDTTASSANCGSCGHACGSTQHCTGSVCVDNSTPGTAGTSGTAGTAGTAGTTGTAGTIGSGGRGGTTGTAGTTGAAGTTAASTLVTSAQNAYWLTTGTLTTVTSGTADLTVTDTTTYQTWQGFGGAFNEMGWDDLAQLSAADRDRAMSLLFSTTDGARFVFGRVPIGASDYATDRYTDDETPNDYTMASFSIARDKQKLIPFVKAALALNSSLRLWASPWTPPTWMKTTSGSDTGTACTGTGTTAFDGGCMKDDAQVLQAHALYLAKWVQAYSGEGIKIEAIHPQNEPGYATGYPSCLWTPALFTKFIGTYLGPTFASQGVTAQIYLGTMSNNDSGKDGTILSTVTADATAMSFIKGFGLQWNMLPVVSTYTSKNLPILQTEHKCGNYPWNPAGLPAFNASKAPNDHPYAIESWGYIRDWIKAGVTSYSSWNMVLDTIGTGIDAGRVWPQNALLTVDRTAKTLTATPAYYVFRHVSQYVNPGAKRVAITGTNPDAIAFKNPDGSIVTIMYNSGTAAKSTLLAAGGAKLQFSVPASGFATVVKR